MHCPLGGFSLTTFYQSNLSAPSVCSLHPQIKLTLTLYKESSGFFLPLSCRIPYIAIGGSRETTIKQLWRPWDLDWPFVSFAYVYYCCLCSVPDVPISSYDDSYWASLSLWTNRSPQLLMDRSSWMVTWCSMCIILSLPEPSNAPEDVFQRRIILYYCLNGFTPELQGPDLWFCHRGSPQIPHSIFPTTDTYVPCLLPRPLQFCSHSSLLRRLLLRSVLELEQYSQLGNMLPCKFSDPSSRDFYSHISVWAQGSALRKPPGTAAGL